MKRILGMIFLLFFGICGTVGGAALFSGCSQSQTETGGGGGTSELPEEIFTVSICFDDNCSDVVHNMPKTEKKDYVKNDNNIKAINIEIGQKIPIREGFIFVEWNTKADGSGDSYDPGDFISVNTNNLQAFSETLYAQWEVSAQATQSLYFFYEFYCSANPSISVSAQSSNYQSVVEVWPDFIYWNSNYGSEIVRVTFTISSSNDYLIQIYKDNAFVQETNSDSITYEWYTSSTQTIYIKLYQKYNVRFNVSPTGNPSFSSKTVTYMQPYGDLPTVEFSEDGWRFLYWENSDGNQVTSTTIVTTKGNHTLYSYYEAYLYKIDINILSPSGEQDYQSGVMDVNYSGTPTMEYFGVSDQPQDYLSYYETLTISNIIPAEGYYVSNVYCTNGGDLSYTNGVCYYMTPWNFGIPSGDWDDTIVIQMAWKEFPVDIKIYDMYQCEYFEYGVVSALMDLSYSDGTQYKNVRTEHMINDESKKIIYNGFVTISNIRPDSSDIAVKNITCDNGTLTDNGDGSYRFTANPTNVQNGGVLTIIIQLTALFYDEDEGYFYQESGEYPQSYAAVEWDYYIGDGDYGGARITYNKTSNILTLDGTMTSGTGTILRTRGLSFVSGQVYTVWREYIGGGVSIQNNTGTSLVIDTIVKNSDDGPSTRNNNDSGVDSRGSSNLTINSASQNEADGFKFWIWLNTGTTITFDNYQIRIYVCYDNLLVNWSLSEVGTMANPANSEEEIPVYSVNTQIADVPAGTKFVLVNNRWFKVEPIRWRVTDFATEVSITGGGGWETIGQTISVKANTEYTIELNYSTPSYTPLSGYNGLALMVLTSSPTDDDCTSMMIERYQMVSNSKGTAMITFNSGNNTQLYVVLNFGYVNDGTNYTFEFGYLRISDKSVKIERDISKWTKYRYGERFSISEISEVSGFGMYLYNQVSISANVLTISAAQNDLSVVKEGWSVADSDLVNLVDAEFSAYSGTYWGFIYQKFGSADQQVKVIADTDTFVELSEPWLISIDEAKSFVDVTAKGSDLVCFLLGCDANDTIDYWTRDLAEEFSYNYSTGISESLGGSLGNGKIITKAGSVKSNWLDEVNGVRLAFNVSTWG